MDIPGTHLPLSSMQLFSNGIMLMLLGNLSFVFEVQRWLALALNHGAFSFSCELIGTFPFNLQ